MKTGIQAYLIISKQNWSIQSDEAVTIIAREDSEKFVTSNDEAHTL